MRKKHISYSNNRHSTPKIMTIFPLKCWNEEGHAAKSEEGWCRAASFPDTERQEAQEHMEFREETVFVSVTKNPK